MSGICGFLAADPVSNGREIMDRLSGWTLFYGHDGHGEVLTDSFALGCYAEHFSAAVPKSSPVIEADGETAVIDALLYNRDELAEALNEDVSALSDEMLVYRLLKSFGAEGLKKINGDFAGAVYRESDGSLTLFRDHMGVRPLYVYRDDRMIAFSTDMRALLALPDCTITPDEEQLYLHAMGYSPLSPDATEYRQIRCVRPGSVFRADASLRVSQSVYWQAGEKKTRFDTEDEYIAELRRLTEDSVKRRADAADGLLGAELSGGLDSSVIDILLNRLGRKAVYVSWSDSPEKLEMAEGDERYVIRDICAQENIECLYLDRDGDPDLKIQHFPPFANTVSIYRTADLVRSRGARTVFSGHTGDEGVSHRCNVLELWHEGEYGSFFRTVYERTEGETLRLLRTVKRSGALLLKDRPKRFGGWRSDASAEAVFTEAFREKMKNVRAPEMTFNYDPRSYIRQGGSRGRLDNTAFQGAENGVRYLFPYADHRLIDFAVSVPRRLYIRGNVSRYIFRRAFDDLMPESLRQVNYKDQPSTRKQFAERKGSFTAEMADQVLSGIDMEKWSGILDPDAARRSLITEETSDPHTLDTVTKVLITLGRCSNIQDALKYAGENSLKNLYDESESN